MIAYIILKFQSYMFKNLYQSVIDKISNLNPIKPFIKYALDRTLNEFLKKELTLDDFKNGPLNLNNIEINSDKINRQHLISSPYILHYGIIGYLKISLPPLSQISTQSIQINISDIQITLKPNKKFSENFKQKMIQLHEINKFYVQQHELEGEISENGPVDFFKQLLKKIIMNIKIKVSNVVIKLYMNSPNHDQSHPQYYTMMRIPIIHFDKKQEKQIKKQETQELKFNILVPQLSLHLLREDFKYPDYSNIEYTQNDFPFKYPPITHPSTILLIGSQIIPEGLIDNLSEWRKNEKIKTFNFSNFGLSLTKDFKKKSKEVSVKIDLQNIEIMINPVQLKILSRFIVQILEFKKILSSIIEELKDDTNGQINLNKKKSQQSTYYNNNDFFSSLVLSMSEDLPSRISRSRSSGRDIVSNFMKQDKRIRQSIANFNKQCQKQLMNTMRNGIQVEESVQSVEPQSQFHAINFSKLFSIRLDISHFHIYLLKYLTTMEYKRLWHQVNHKKINQNIGCSYFMFTLTKCQFDHKSHDKLTLANFKKLKIYNVKLKGKKVESSIDDYYDIKNSVQFYEMDNKSMNKKKEEFKEPELKEFIISQQEHYCIEQILRISQSESEAKSVGALYKKYNFIPKIQQPGSQAYTLYKPGFNLHIDKKQNYIKVNVEVVTVSINFEILQDFLNIIYPVFTYRRLSDWIIFKRSELKLSSEKKKLSFLQSHYEHRMDIEAEQEGKGNNRNVLIVEVEQVKLCVRKGGLTNGFDNLVRKSKQKIYDHQSFNNSSCFCNLNESGIYLQFYGIQYKDKSPALKVSCRKAELGMMTIKDSAITNISSVISLQQLNKQENFKLFKDLSYAEIFTIYIPFINAKLQEQPICKLITFAIQSIRIFDNLFAYHHFLRNEMMIIQQQSEQLPRKQKKNDQTERQIRVFIDSISLYALFMTIKANKVYFTNADDQILIKIRTLVAGLSTNIRNKMCEFRNQEMMITQYPFSSKYKPIPDANIIFELSDYGKDEKSVFKSAQRQAFFSKAYKQSSTLNLRISKKQTERKRSFKDKQPSLSQKFKFKQMSSTIEEEGEKQIISVNVTKNIILYLCNIMEVVHLKERIQNFFKCIKETKESFTQMQSQAIMLMERKQSCEIQNESIQINAKLSRILVDIRPQFINNGKQRIYGNTRSILSIEPRDTNFYFNKVKNVKEISSQIDISVNFLKTDDRDIELNPILFPEHLPITQLGFKNIVEINRLGLKVQISEKQKGMNINLNTNVKYIYGQLSVETMLLIKLHIEYFMRHHMKKEYGVSLQEMYENEQFCNLEFNGNEQNEEMEILQYDDEFIVQDLTDSLANYEEKMNKKIEEENKFKMRSFIHKNIDNAFLTVNSISIDKVNIRIYNGDDYNFIKKNGLVQSAGRRQRNKCEEDNRFMTLIFSKLQLRLCLSKDKKAFSTFLKLEKLKLFVSKQKSNSNSFYGLRHLEEQIPQQQFIICENESQMSIIFEKSQENMNMKSLALRAKLGVTSELVTFIKYVKEHDKMIERGGWKKIYDSKPKEKKQNKKNECRMIVIIPESHVKLSLQYENFMNILDQQNIITSELIINEEMSNMYSIQNTTNKWMKKLMKDNIGTIISKTALNLLLKLIAQIVALNLNYLAKLLGFINFN